MQSWSLRKDIVMAVPKSDLLILDLGGKNKTTENFWGYPFVYGTIHNFGGRINMHGDLADVSTNRYEALKSTAANLCGAGFFMEGINQNTVFYDLLFEMNYRSGKVDVNTWLKNYASRRYGVSSSSATQAWSLLLKGPYRSEGANLKENSSIIAARPALDVKKSGPNAGLKIPYPESLLYESQELLLKDVNVLKISKPYRFDLVDVQRQIMTNLAQTIHKKAIEAYRNKDKKAFKLHSERFLELLSDADEMLRTTSVYNFDQWLADARQWGTTPAEKDLLERDATSLLTIWGSDGPKMSNVFDYAWREWSGLIEGFYKVRWKMFYDMLGDTLDKDIVYSEKGLPMILGREAFRANDIYKKIADFEERYVVTYQKQRTPIVRGDEVKIVNKLFIKYRKLFSEYGNGVIQSEPTKKEGKTYENLGD